MTAGAHNRMVRSSAFDTAAAEMSQSLKRAANWKEVYYGASYTARVEAGIEEARAACDRMSYFLLQEKQSCA